MSDENVTGTLVKLAGEVGRTAAAVEALSRKIDDLGSTQMRRIEELESRVDDLESDRDTRAGAEEQAAKSAAEALGRVDRRIKILGAVVAIIGAVDVVLRLAAQ